MQYSTLHMNDLRKGQQCHIVAYLHLSPLVPWKSQNPPLHQRHKQRIGGVCSGPTDNIIPIDAEPSLPLNLLAGERDMH